MKRIVNYWGASLSIRMDKEFQEIGVKPGEEVRTRVEDDKIIVEKIKPKFSTSEGVEFAVKK